jgi:hypothetical protein
MDGESCPCCGGAATVAGSTSPVDDVPCFRPFLRRNLRYWFHHFNGHTGVEVREGFRACLSCGLVWGRLPPDRLREFMVNEKVGSPLKPEAVEADL